MATRSFLSGIALSALLVACGSPDGAVDDALSGDPSPDGGVTADPQKPVCAEPLTGGQAFGRVLAGEADFVSRSGLVRRAKVEVQAYFPGGRRPGEAVYLAMPGVYPRLALAWSGPFTLDAAGGVPATPGMQIANDLGVSWKGALLGGGRGLDGEGAKNFSFGSDVYDEGTAARLSLCPADPLPDASLRAGDTIFAPNLPLWLAPTAPLDPAGLATVKVRAGELDVPVTVTLASNQSPWPGKALLITPVQAFPPGQALTIDPGELADVLGRRFSPTVSPPALATTAESTDLSFESAPPAGAIASLGRALVDGGKLRVGEPPGRSGSGVRALVALGDGGGAATQARLRIAVACERGRLFSSAVLVGATGDASPIPLACGAAQDVSVAIPESGPLWLSIVVDPPRNHPQSLPWYESNVVEIDEIVFE